VQSADCREGAGIGALFYWMKKSCVSGITSERQSSFTGFNRRPAGGCESFCTRPHLAGDRDMQSRSATQLRPLRQINRILFFDSGPQDRRIFGRGVAVSVFLLLIFSFFSSRGLAVDFYGSDPLGSTGLTVAPGVDLLNTDQFYLTQVFGNPGTGDFGSVPYFMILTPEDWLIDISDFSGLTFGNESFGTFTATSGSVVSRTPDFVTAELTGLFDHTSVDDTPATLNFAMTQTGQSISWSGTLAVGLDAGSNVVPEPTSSLFGALGFVSLFVLTRRRRT
jgi:hypothetical protein